MDPILTGHHLDSTVSAWPVAIGTLGGVALIATIICLCQRRYWSQSKEKYMRIRGARYWKPVLISGLITIVMLTMFVVAVRAVHNDPGHTASDDREIHGDAIEKAISSKYEITSITGTDDLALKSGSFVLFKGASSSDMDARLKKLCSPVNTGSYELTGVANGQQISFRVGFADCRHPDPQIVITSTPGQAMSPDDLRKD